MTGSRRPGLATGLSMKVSTTRALLVLFLALLIVATLVFAILGPVLDGAHAVADGGSARVDAALAFGGGVTLDAGPS